MAQAQYVQGGETVDFTPVAACSAGDVVQLPGGRAGVCTSDIAAGVLGSAYVCGVFKVAKTASIAMLIGGDAYFDVSAGKANFKKDAASADFWMGTVFADAAGSGTTVDVDLNKSGKYQIDLENPGEGGGWTTSETNGLGLRQATVAGIPLPGVWNAALDNTSEAAMAQLVSNHSVLVSSKPIFEAVVGIFDATASATDIDFGLATGGHATDFETVTNFAAFHADGGDANIDTHSDDNSTDRAPADSTIDWVDDTYAHYWIDARDDTNVKFYVDGVLVDTSASKRILTAALASSVKAVLEVEKTSSTDVAEVRVTRMRVRTQAE